MKIEVGVSGNDVRRRVKDKKMTLRHQGYDG